MKTVARLGHWGPMAALIALGYVAPDNHWLAILLLTIAVGINAATYLGFQVSKKSFQKLFKKRCVILIFYLDSAWFHSVYRPITLIWRPTMLAR